MTALVSISHNISSEQWVLFDLKGPNSSESSKLVFCVCDRHDEASVPPNFRKLSEISRGDLDEFSKALISSNRSVPAVDSRWIKKFESLLEVNKLLCSRQIEHGLSDIPFDVVEQIVILPPVHVLTKEDLAHSKSLVGSTICIRAENPAEDIIGQLEVFNKRPNKFLMEIRKVISVKEAVDPILPHSKFPYKLISLDLGKQVNSAKELTELDNWYVVDDLELLSSLKLEEPIVPPELQVPITSIESYPRLSNLPKAFESIKYNPKGCMRSMIAEGLRVEVSFIDEDTSEILFYCGVIHRVSRNEHDLINSKRSKVMVFFNDGDGMTFYFYDSGIASDDDCPVDVADRYWNICDHALDSVHPKRFVVA
jgi:hypothetical protein